MYTPDIKDLPEREIANLTGEILDPHTGKLKETGYLNQDFGLIFNRDAVPPNPDNNWIREITKRRHQILIVTFSPQKVSIQRLFDFEINCVALTIHMLKAGVNKFDALESMADDMTTKEPAGIVHSNTSSLSIEPFNVTSSYMSLKFTEKEDFDK